MGGHSSNIKPSQRAGGASVVVADDVGIYLRGAQIIVTKKLLDGSDIGSRLKKMCCKRVAESMGADLLLGQTSLPDRNRQEFSDYRVMKMMAT